MYQLPIQSAPSKYPICTDHSSVVLGLSIDTNGLDHLTEVDKIPELIFLSSAADEIVSNIVLWESANVHNCLTKYMMLMLHCHYRAVLLHCTYA
jgi:hypothetical protein